jgi:hypothetical protein
MTEIKTDVAQNTNTAADVEKVVPVGDSAVDGQDTKSSLDTAVDQDRLAEEKRLTEAKDEDLSDEDKSKKAELLKAKSAAQAKVVPEKYEVKVPEGFSNDMSLLETITPVLKEIGVTNEQAQKLADAYMPFFKAKAEEGRKAVQAEQEQSFKTFIDGEKKNTKDKFGAKWNDEMSFIAKFRDAHLSPKTVELLNASGIAENYEFLSDLAKFGRMISEDKLVDGKRVSNADKSPADILFPK